MAEVNADMTGLRFARADVPLLDRVLTALRGGTEAFTVPEGYLTGGDGGRLRRRPGWQFGQPPQEFTVALARLRRLTVTCPGAEVRQHTEVPWQWAGTVPGVCDDDKPVFVTGGNLGELATAMEAAAERRVGARAALDGLRASWGDSYIIWYAGERWQARRRDGFGAPMSAPAPDALYRLVTQDATFWPARPS